MKNKNECFCVKYEGKNYCRCFLSLSSSCDSAKALSFAEDIFGWVREFCETIYEYDPKNESDLRKDFNIVPYFFCVDIYVESASERLFFIRIEYCFRARFPGGKEYKEKKGIIFDEKLALPLFPDSLKNMSVFSHINANKTHFDNVYFADDNIKLVSDKEVISSSYKAFENEYLLLVKKEKGEESP